MEYRVILRIRFTDPADAPKSEAGVKRVMERIKKLAEADSTVPEMDIRVTDVLETE